MSDAPSSPDPTAPERVYFDLWTLDEAWQRIGGPDANDDLYCWVDDLCPRRGGDWVGLASFRGRMTDENTVECIGWFQIDHNPGGWTGSVVARGKVTLRSDGSVEGGSLAVISSSANDRFTITISRENPKRYIASG